MHALIAPRLWRMRQSQRGASLLFALITLVALMLAAVALVRSVNSGSMILGNIGFQQDATASAELATRAAISWLTTSGADLTVSSTATAGSAAVDRTGFYANAKDPLDATGQQLTSAADVATRQLVDWDLDGKCAYAGAGLCTIIPHDVDMSGTGASAGTTAKYVILRLCKADGAMSSDSCSQPLTGGSSGGVARGACSVRDCDRLGTASGQYFRIVVRVQGARGTTSVTETIVQY
ncbi:MAG: hypothetical protein KGL90_14855 [Burkholderiales bacterium]|nr:hypothetical protein [Burkholderiales bacterium]